MTQENLLARYGILHELGRGPMGAVYAARDRQTGAAVALKRLDPVFLGKSGAGFAERFLKAARSARALKHRNIVEIHDAGEVGGTVFVAMEMLEGKNLRGILDEGPLPVVRAIRIAHDVACGLAHAHLQSVLHGALKPSNVIVLRSGVAKITDFGTGYAGPSYSSPERLRGEALDHRCDVFSLGALLYEMLAHRLPFEGSTAKEILENISRGRPPLPSRLNPLVPRALDAIVLGMLAAQPAVRMAGAPVLHRDLQRLEEALGLGSGASAAAEEATPSAAPPAAPQPRPRRLEPNRIPEPAPVQEAPAFDYQKAMAMMERESRRERSSGSRPAIFAAFALAVLGIGVAGFMYYPSLADLFNFAAGRVQETLVTALETSRPPAPAPAAPAPVAAEPAPSAPTAVEAARPIAPTPVVDATPASAPAPVAPPAPPPAVDDPQPQKAPAAEPSPPAKVESVVARAPARPAPPKAPQSQPAATARLILAVSPRGELYIDGKHHGTTPPLTTFDIEPGMHRIEVRSGSRTPYLTYMMVQAGDVRRIQHDFDTTHAVHPPASASWRNRERASR